MYGILYNFYQRQSLLFHSIHKSITEKNYLPLITDSIHSLRVQIVWFRGENDSGFLFYYF